jgi:hypothetical protein
LVLVGILLGVVGYAAFRGDLAWTSPVPRLVTEHAAEFPKAAPAAPPDPAPAPLPELPISLSFHETRKGRGCVVRIRSTNRVLAQIEGVE